MDHMTVSPRIQKRPGELGHCCLVSVRNRGPFRSSATWMTEKAGVKGGHSREPCGMEAGARKVKGVRVAR